MAADLVGEVVLPPDTPVGTAAMVRIEVRDTSLLDVPSTVVAAEALRGVPIGPGGRIPFGLQADLPGGRTLTLRVHVSIDGSEATRPGDLLTTESVTVPDRLPQVPVHLVR